MWHWQWKIFVTKNSLLHICSNFTRERICIKKDLILHDAFGKRPMKKTLQGKDESPKEGKILEKIVLNKEDK
jgi:hypothetical protein